MSGTLLPLAAIGTACTLAAALPAAAADRPPIQPTRDVMVEYRVAEHGLLPNMPHPDRVKVYFTANATRLRVEAAGLPMYMVMDRGAHRMEVVMPAQRSYLELPYDAKTVASFTAGEGAAFARKGTDTVAGMSCTVWDVKAQQSTGTICMTNDGVLLRAEGQEAQRRGGSLLALSVVYGAQSAELFAPPAGFMRMDLPRGISIPPGVLPGIRPPG